MDWFYIALIAPALWALVNLLDDNLIRGVYSSPAFATIISGLLAAMPVLSLFFVDINIPSLNIVFVALLGGFLLLSSYLFYFKALLEDSPSVVITLWKLSPAVVPFLAYFFLKEVLTLNQYLGFVIILGASLGISAVNIKKFQFSRAFYLMVVASGFTAVSAILFKWVYNHTDFWSGFVFVSLGMGLGGLIYILVLKDGKNFFSDLNKKKKWLGIFVLAEILNISAVLFSNLALSQGPVSLVKVVEGVQPIYIILFSFLLYPFFPKYFREVTSGNTKRKTIFILIMLVGLYLINF